MTSGSTLASARPNIRFMRGTRGLWAVTMAACTLVFASCATADAGAGVMVRVGSPAAASCAPSARGSGSGPTGTPIPTPELILSTTDVYQGGAILASLTGSVSGGSITFLGRSYPLTKGSQSYFSFLGIDTGDPTGPQQLEVGFTLSNGTKGSLNESVTVEPTKWTVDSLNFALDKEGLLDPRVADDETALLKSIYSKVTPKKYWSGGWALPLDGPVTAHYGEQRSISGAPASGHHAGTDIAVPEGTPVKATNRGKVVLARQLPERGNTVIIDHGGGLYSGYGHMSAFTVSEGEMVNQGDVIGLSGNTGLSTGPHLHWEIAIDGIWLDALRFVDGSNGF